MRPIFSFITAVYNEEKSIIETVESVTNQGVDEYEYIIIDDGSTDNTPQIIDELAKNNGRIRVIHQENQWVYPSFNNGIKYANGEYIFIINADDTLVQGILPNVKQIITKSKPDVIFGLYKTNICDENHKIIKEDYYQKNNKSYEDIFLPDKYQYYSNIYKLWQRGYCWGQTSFFKAEIAKKILFKETKYCADTIFNIDMIEEIESAYVMGQPIYNHFKYINKKNISEKYYETIHDEQNIIFYLLKSKLKATCWKDEINKAACYARLTGLSSEYRRLSAPNCNLSISQKLRYIFIDSMDDCIQEVANILDDKEQVEARALSAARDILSKEKIDVNDDMFFVYQLLDALLRYEKDDIDYHTIKNAINNINNPFRLGESFFKKLYVL